MWNIWKFIKLFVSLFIGCLCFTLVWCWSGWDGDDGVVVNVAGYRLHYDWNVKLWKVPLKTDDLDEITELYQEVWDDVWYRDSLLIAEKYAQWLWVNTFAQENLDMLNEHWLTLSDIKKTQIWLKNSTWNVNAVLVDYKITEWFISSVPVLYVSQLFIPNKYNIKLISYITEDSSSHSYAVNMLKNIK